MRFLHPHRFFCQTILLLLLLASAIISTPNQANARFKTPDGSQYISRETLASQLVKETGWSLKDIRAVLKRATFRPNIIKQMNRQWEAQPYANYRPLFVKPIMRKKGLAYLKQNQAIFTQMEQHYHVDAAIIAAILGIETRFGESHGNKPVLDSLYTLSTGFPRRAAFFRQQLAAIIEITRQDHLHLDTLKGSYAGAFGSIQFIPTSFKQYAVDGDGDGVRDVFHSQADIIASVANYFSRHHWQQHRPSAYWLPVGTRLSKHWQQIATGQLKHWVRLATLRHDMPGIFHALPKAWRNDDKVSIIEMTTQHGRQFALVHYNFYVIMRYNPSFNYAMAVTEIAAMLEDQTFAVD